MSVKRTKPRIIEFILRFFHIRDLILIIICIAGIISFINLFWKDLFQTLTLQNVQPVGNIIVIQNIVQRRIEDRVLWDRLAAESPVYSGDVIRAAELSSAMINLDGQQLDLNENTLIRIQRAVGDDGILIELEEGSLGLTTTEEGGRIYLNVMGTFIETSSGTTLYASADKDGIVVQVNEGYASFVDVSGQSREITTGGLFSADLLGNERIGAAAVVIRPKPNARYLKSARDPVTINFSWNRVNLEFDDQLRLEISYDRGFNRVVQTLDNLFDSAMISLNAGTWFWRLSINNENFFAGSLHVLDASGVNLLTPVRDSTINYRADYPDLYFQWSEAEEASHYILEISDMPDFRIVEQSVDVFAVSFIRANLDEGTWYWRITPVYSSGYEGRPASTISRFFVKHTGVPGAADTAAVENEGIILPDLPLFESETEAEQSQPGEPSASEIHSEEINTDETQSEQTQSEQTQTEESRQLEEAPPENTQPQAPPPPLVIRLTSPAQGVRMNGLTALRTPTEFRWESNRDIIRSRFILSRNANPLRRPEVVINNPGRVVTVNRIEEGVWYWTVEAADRNGIVSSSAPRQLQVLSIPLLPAPGNMTPGAGYQVNIEHLRNQRNISFNWSSVPDANAYLLSIFEQTPSGRRLVIRTSPETRTSWTLEKINDLSRGTFVWQIEAVNRNRSGVIEQRGIAGESSFIIDIPQPEVRANKPGVLYGN